MKLAYFLSLIAVLGWSLSMAQNQEKTSAVVEPVSQDSTEYELLIIDIHFEQWYLLNYNEAKDRSDEYYHSKNLVAVNNWNDLYRRGEYIDIIDSHINYQPQIDYGIELNRKLYWYFKFVEDHYKVRLW